MIRKYITWTPKYVNKHLFEHPDGKLEALWKDITMINQPYSGDLRHVAIIEYENLSDNAWGRFLNNFSEFAFFEETPNRIIELLTEWYGDYFSLDEDGFTIIDERPKEDELL